MEAPALVQPGLHGKFQAGLSYKVKHCSYPKTTNPQSEPSLKQAFQLYRLLGSLWPWSVKLQQVNGKLQ